MKLKKVVKKLVALGLAAALIAADIPIMTHAETLRQQRISKFMTKTAKRKRRSQSSTMGRRIFLIPTPSMVGRTSLQKIVQNMRALFGQTKRCLQAMSLRQRFQVIWKT